MRVFNRWVERLIADQRALPRPLQLPTLIALTSFFVGTAGLLLTIPPGPWCDDGPMPLFMEGGCDWGNTNIFFFSRLGLLLAVNLTAVVLVTRPAPTLRGLPLHLGVLVVLIGDFAVDSRCDTYYSHPNGSTGQSVAAIAAFAILGIAVVRSVQHLSRALRLLSLAAWNASFVAIFYAALKLFPYWRWSHTLVVSGALLFFAVCLELRLGRSKQDVPFSWISRDGWLLLIASGAFALAEVWLHPPGDETAIVALAIAIESYRLLSAAYLSTRRRLNA